MAKGQSLQDPFLNALRRERVPVSIYLVNGIKLQGQIAFKNGSCNDCPLAILSFPYMLVVCCK